MAGYAHEQRQTERNKQAALNKLKQNMSPKPTPAPVAPPKTARENMLEDVQAGREFATDIVAPGSLGRMGTNADIQNIIKERRARLSGLTGQEMGAARDVATQAISGQTQTQLRALRAAQGRSGVRGATAVGQQADILGAGAQRQSEFERDLLLRNRAEQGQALNELGQDVGQVTQFDLAQAAREKMAELSGGMGFAQLGVAERTGSAAAQANKEAAGSKGSGGLIGSIMKPLTGGK